MSIDLLGENGKKVYSFSCWADLKGYLVRTKSEMTVASSPMRHPLGKECTYLGEVVVTDSVTSLSLWLNERLGDEELHSFILPLMEKTAKEAEEMILSSV